MPLEPHQPLDGVSPCEAVSSAFAVLMQSLEEVGRDTRVEGAVRRLRKQINARLLHAPRREEGGPRVKPGVTGGKSAMGRKLTLRLRVPERVASSHVSSRVGEAMALRIPH